MPLDGTRGNHFRGTRGHLKPINFLSFPQGAGVLRHIMRKFDTLIGSRTTSSIPGAKKMYGSRAPLGAQYYCRGCGEKLPPDWHAQFHPQCLKADKRRRTQERRRWERERLLALLERQKCPVCGSAMSQEPKRSRREASPSTPYGSGPPSRAA